MVPIPSLVPRSAVVASFEHLTVAEAFWNTARAAWLRGKGDCRNIGLTNAQASVLFAVGFRGPIFPSELARQLGLSRQATSSAMNHLERQGLVRRAHSEQDRRRVPVAFTDKGRRNFERLRSRQHAIHRAINGAFSGSKRSTALAVLSTIAKEIDPARTVPTYPCALCTRERARRRGGA
ncbi:MAG: MarR family transcriptional regulator [Thermoplasmata archaeon]|nr:MarR family transcriptional regulator [Thermoplasmata archaeon]